MAAFVAEDGSSRAGEERCEKATETGRLAGKEAGTTGSAFERTRGKVGSSSSGERLEGRVGSSRSSAAEDLTMIGGSGSDSPVSRM